MKPILFPAEETQFRSNGLGRLSEATKCHVTEERNGQYELELMYPATGRHYAELAEERIILSRHEDSDDLQPFRIYKITRPMNGLVTVYARHVSYQQSKVVVMPFSADVCATALSGMVEHAVGDCPFTVWTDREIQAHFELKKPATFRSLLGGTAGSILDVYGPGEYEWDRFTVKFHTHRGSDQNVMIRYGKNMTDVKKTTDTSSLWNGIVPYWTGAGEGEQAVLVTLPEGAVYVEDLQETDTRMVIPVDFSSAIQSQPTEEDLRTRATSYVRSNAPSSIPETIDVSFVALWQTEEYKNWAPLQKLKLCDTVTVYHKELGIKSKAKIVSVTYDALLERYEKMTIGDAKTNLDDSIRQISEEIKNEIPSDSSMAQAAMAAVRSSLGTSGGNIRVNYDESGHPTELLAMDQPDAEEARNILKLWRYGLSVGHEGIHIPFLWLISAEGTINAQFLRNYIRDQAGNLMWNLHNGSFTGKRLTVDQLSSGDGFSGIFTVGEHQITVREGIVTDVTGTVQPLSSASDGEESDGETSGESEGSGS